MGHQCREQAGYQKRGEWWFRRSEFPKQVPRDEEEGETGKSVEKDVGKAITDGIQTPQRVIKEVREDHSRPKVALSRGYPCIEHAVTYDRADQSEVI